MDNHTLTKLEYFEYDPAQFRAARQQAEKSIEEISTLLNVHRKTIERLEQGENGSYEIAVRFCRHVGLNPLIAIKPIDPPVGKRRGREALPKNLLKNST